MGIRVERPESGEPTPEGMNGFILSHVRCEHGTPYVMMEVWKDGEQLAARVMDPTELVQLAQSFVDAAAECESARQLQTYRDGTIPWSPAGPGDEAGFGPWPRGPHRN